MGQSSVWSCSGMCLQPRVAVLLCAICDAVGVHRSSADKSFSLFFVGFCLNIIFVYVYGFALEHRIRNLLSFITKTNSSEG